MGGAACCRTATGAQPRCVASTGLAGAPTVCAVPPTPPATGAITATHTDTNITLRVAAPSSTGGSSECGWVLGCSGGRRAGPRGCGPGRTGRPPAHPPANPPSALPPHASAPGAGLRYSCTIRSGGTSYTLSVRSPAPLGPTSLTFAPGQKDASA